MEEGGRESVTVRPGAGPATRAYSSAEEHSVYTRAVVGSIPTAPTDPEWLVLSRPDRVPPQWTERNPALPFDGEVTPIRRLLVIPVIKGIIMFFGGGEDGDS